jgi:hypothetical protein
LGESEHLGQLPERRLPPAPRHRLVRLLVLLVLIGIVGPALRVAKLATANKESAGLRPRGCDSSGGGREEEGVDERVAGIRETERARRGGSDGKVASPLLLPRTFGRGAAKVGHVAFLEC